MRNTYLLVALLAVVVFMAAAPSVQRPSGGAVATQTDVIQVCLIESVVPMGIGRSKLIITFPTAKRRNLTAKTCSAPWASTLAT